MRFRRNLGENIKRNAITEKIIDTLKKHLDSSMKAISSKYGIKKLSL